MALIEYRNVCIARKEQVVLRDVNLVVNEGDFVFLLGKVGSGKSTFLETLYSETPIESGEAYVMEFDLREIRQRQIPYLRRKIGIVFQDFKLLTDRSVDANLEFVLRATGMSSRREIDERIAEVLKYVGMSQKGYKMPHELSGGEQQRIVIARALLNRSKLLLADEATGQLDPETGRELMDLFHRISNEGTAVIMATHNHAWTERYAGRLVVCEDGKMVETSSSSVEF